MNNQFATQFLLNEVDAYESLKAALKELGSTDDAAEMIVKAVENGILTPSKAIEIVKSTLGVNETSAVGGGVTGGPTAATVTPGAGEQVAGAKKAFKKKYQEDAPRLAGSPAKTNKQGSKNLDAYSSVGFTKAPSAEEAGKKIKGVEVEDLWEGQRYSQFKKEATMRTKDQQMHEAVKMIHRRLEEVGKLLEFTKQMKSELSEGEVLEYNHNTKKALNKIKSKVIEVYSLTKALSHNPAGLMVVGRTSKDNYEIGKMVKELGLNGVWNAKEGHWFFKEDGDRYNELRRELQDELDDRYIDAEIEGVDFGNPYK